METNDKGPRPAARAFGKKRYERKTQIFLTLCFFSILGRATPLLLILGSATVYAQDARDLLQRAAEKFDARDFTGTAALLEDVTARQPNNASALILLGKSYHHLGRLGAAQASFEKAISLDRQSPEASYNLAMVLLDKGELQSAEKILAELCQNNKNPDYWHDLGVIKERLGQDEQSLQCYQDAIKLEPNRSQFHSSLARRLYLNHQLDQSIEEYKKALALDPSNIDAHNNLGVAFSESGKYPEALEQYQAALQLNSRYPEAQQNLGYAQAHTSLGITYYKQNNRGKALEEYQLALSIDPNFADAYYNLGVLYQSQGTNEKAEQAYLAAIRLSPTNAKAHNNLGVIYHKLGKSQLAETEYKEALGLKPDFAEAQQNLQALNAKP